jgi:hypothetical protein
MKHNLNERKRVVEESKDDQRAWPGPGQSGHAPNA